MIFAMAADGKIRVLAGERKYTSDVSLAPRPFRYANTVYRPRNSLSEHASPRAAPPRLCTDGIRGIQRKSGGGGGGGRDLEEMDAAVKRGRADFPRREWKAARHSALPSPRTPGDRFTRHHEMTSSISAILSR